MIIDTALLSLNPTYPSFGFGAKVIPCLVVLLMVKTSAVGNPLAGLKDEALVQLKIKGSRSIPTARWWRPGL